MEEYKKPILETKSEDMNRMPLNTFQEEQRFGQWWLWLLLAVSAAVVIIPFAIQLMTGAEVGSKPAPTWVLGAFSVLTIGILYLFSKLVLKTYIDQEEIRFHFGILGKKTIRWSDVEKADIIDYGFVGYGKRFSKHGWVYNVAGKWGLKLKLKNGKSLVIGTQKKEELQDFLGNIGRGLS